MRPSLRRAMRFPGSPPPPPSSATQAKASTPPSARSSLHVRDPEGREGDRLCTLLTWSTILRINGVVNPPRKESYRVRREFPPGETDDTTRWIVWFLAVVNGTPIPCGISYQALRTHCAADFHDAMPAFVAHRPRIEACITDLIRQGRFEDEETMVMRSYDMR